MSTLISYCMSSVNFMVCCKRDKVLHKHVSVVNSLMLVHPAIKTLKLMMQIEPVTATDTHNSHQRYCHATIFISFGKLAN